MYEGTSANGRQRGEARGSNGEAHMSMRGTPRRFMCDNEEQDVREELKGKRKRKRRCRRRGKRGGLAHPGKSEGKGKAGRSRGTLIVPRSTRIVIVGGSWVINPKIIATRGWKREGPRPVGDSAWREDR